MQLPEQIETERLILKHPTKPTFKLAEELYKVVDESRETLRKWLPWVDDTNSKEDEFANYLLPSKEKWENGIGFNYLIYQKETDKFLGIITLFNVEEKLQSGEIGYWISDSAAGNGYMQESVYALENTAFKNGINRIVIKNDTLNIRSANVAKRCGYTLEGIMRQDTWNRYRECLNDTNIWSKLKSDWKKDKKRD
ncbi:MAG: GNAT family N-acetyltransferase, partial [Alphaproteobacteria bacterium]|nr:GNAT family N-acetyltransferase [Alphaproteobacteria bacterium]